MILLKRYSPKTTPLQNKFSAFDFSIGHVERIDFSSVLLSCIVLNTHFGSSI